MFVPYKWYMLNKFAIQTLAHSDLSITRYQHIPLSDLRLVFVRQSEHDNQYPYIFDIYAKDKVTLLKDEINFMASEVISCD